MTPCQKEAMKLASFFRDSLEDWHIACDFLDENTVMTLLNTALRNACYTYTRVIKLASNGSEPAFVVIDSVDRAKLNEAFRFRLLTRKNDLKLAFLLGSLISSEVERFLPDLLDPLQVQQMLGILATAIERFLRQYRGQMKGDPTAVLFFSGFGKGIPHDWPAPSLSSNAPDFLAESAR